MNTNNKKIYSTTGDPFVDLGGLVFQTILERYPYKKEVDVVDFIISVYIKQWNENLYSIFHTNSKLLNPSTKGKHEENTKKYYRLIIQNKKTDGCKDEGYCKTCGKKGLLYQNSREFFPNTGSGKFVNFYHSHESGIFLCNECTLKLFFVPLGVLLLDGKNGFLHSQSERLQKFWQERVIGENLNKIDKKTSVGILRFHYTRSVNALFYFAEEIIMEVSDDNYSDYLQLFIFSNFGPDPNCSIFILPNPVFNFLNKVIRYYKRDWNNFINRYYRIKGARWDAANQRWYQEKKKEIKFLEKSDYLNNPNDIYGKLLSNQSILKQLLNSQKMHYQKQLEKFPIEITHHYVTEVLEMTNEQVVIIARIADVIFELSQKENNYKKYLFMLESASKAYQLRGTLLKIIKANFYNGAEKPVIRMKDYVDYLFPDGQYWGEVRDLLLIHLYEKYHDEGINRDEIPEGEIGEAVEDEPVNTL
ncbi:hypothetical protein BMS3Bbin03_02107 [bacterium BMS3Bbin03]|nr:hypothetical protein BMS3Bbin03_02107 [bacterium BMS3Bbin03]